MSTRWPWMEIFPKLYQMFSVARLSALGNSRLALVLFHLDEMDAEYFVKTFIENRAIICCFNVNPNTIWYWMFYVLNIYHILLKDFSQNFPYDFTISILHWKRVNKGIFCGLLSWEYIDWAMKAILSKWLSEEIECVSSKYIFSCLSWGLLLQRQNSKLFYPIVYSISSNLGAHSHHTGREVKWIYE